MSIGRGSVDELGKPCDGSIAATYRPTAQKGTVGLPFARRVSRGIRRLATRQAGADHGRLRIHPDVRRARCCRQSVESGCCVSVVSDLATTSPSAWRTTTATSRSSGDATTPGRLHGVLESADEQRVALRRQRLRSEGVHHLQVQGRPGCGDRGRHSGRRGAADARRHDRRIRVVRAGGRRPVARAARRDRIAGTDMLYSSGTTGSSEGCHPASSTALPLETTPGCVAPVLQMLFGATNDSVYLSPRPSTTRLHCGSRWRRRRWAQRSWRWNTSTPSSTWR